MPLMRQIDVATVPQLRDRRDRRPDRAGRLQRALTI
jgi:hypothetical protein